MPHLIALFDLSMFGVVMTVVGLGGLIFFHELGHFLACRLTRTRVEAFSIGFGKEIFGWTRGPTRYRIGLVPLGGYVKMAAENPGDVGTGSPDEFPNKSFGQRLFIMSNGVIFNILLAFMLFVWAFKVGVPFNRPQLEDVTIGGAAWEAGLEAGDLVTHVNDRPILGFSDLRTEVAFSGADEQLMLTVVRAGHELFIPVRPRYNEALGMPAIDVQGALARSAAGVRDGSPVGLVGGRPGDVVLSAGGVPIARLGDLARASVRLAGESPEGATELKIDVKVRRADGAIESLAVVLPLGERPQLGIQPYEGRIVRAVVRRAKVASLVRPGDEIMNINGNVVGDLGILRQEATDAPLRELTLRRDDTVRKLTPENMTERDLANSVQGHLDLDTAFVAVRPRMAAERSGLLPGDRIVQVEDKEVASWTQLVEAVVSLGVKPMRIVVERGGQRKTLDVKPGRFPKDGDHTLGYMPAPAQAMHREGSVLSAVATGWHRTTRFMKSVVLTIRSLLTARVSGKHIGGPIALASVTYQMLDQGWGRYLYILAIISINLAILNILPIPVLDGGQIVLLCAEKIRGKPLPEKLVGYFQMVGLALILCLLLLAFRNDIVNFILK